MPNQVDLVRHLGMQGIGPSATKCVAVVGMPSVWQSTNDPTGNFSSLGQDLVKGTIQKRRQATAQGCVAISLPTKPGSSFPSFPFLFKKKFTLRK
jgi:hypothetical protein